MKPLIQLPLYFAFVFFALIYSAQVLPRLGTDSLTNDEPTEITNGYYYLTQGDVVTPHLHPPLASAFNALPLLGLNLKEFPYSGDVMNRAHSFIFNWNVEKLESITFWSRLVSWVFGLLIGGVLFWITRAHYSWCAATLFFWAFNPTLLTLAGIAKIEIIPTFFFLMAVWLFSEALKTEKVKVHFVAGVLTAMAITAKYYALILIPVFLILELAHTFSRQNPGRWTQLLKRWGCGIVGFVLMVFVVYVPALWFSQAQGFNLLSPMEKLLEDVVFARHPFPVYFWGRSSLESHWYYFPVAFVLKEPLTFIFMIVLALGLWFQKKALVPLWQWVPVLLFGVAILPATNLGVRYLLPIYPFLFLIAAQGLVWLWQQRSQKILFLWAFSGLILWQMVSVLSSFPHTLSYFNELIPSDKKMGYLADSNLDWGQDTKRLVEESRKRNWGKVKLAYFGAVDPKVYGLDWEPLRSNDLKNPQPGWVYVMNASFYQLAPTAYPPTLAIVQSWLGQTEPTGKVGDSWYYFEVPGQKAEEPKTKWLPSVPFLQDRGYCAYPLNFRE